MFPDIEAVVAKYGVAGLLAGVRTIIQREAEDLEELGDPDDADTVARLDAIASKVLAAALDYDHIPKAEQRM
jgi:hypothetical protein